MFQLVVAVISIALIAFLALTSLYYGGDAFQSSSLRAGVTTLINAGQQISGAAIIYKTDTGGIAAASVAELVAPTLVDNMTYLSSAPGGSAFTGDNAWAIDATAKFVTIAIDVPGSTDEICTEVARQAGNSGQFFCGDEAGAVGTTHFVYGLGTNGGSSGGGAPVDPGNPPPPVDGGGDEPPVNPEPPVDEEPGEDVSGVPTLVFPTTASSPNTMTYSQSAQYRRNVASDGGESSGTMVIFVDDMWGQGGDDAEIKVCDTAAECDQNTGNWVDSSVIEDGQFVRIRHAGSSRPTVTVALLAGGFDFEWTYTTN